MLKARNRRRLQRASLLVAALFMLSLQMLWACDFPPIGQPYGMTSADHAAMRHDGASHASSDQHDCCPIKPAANAACDGNCQAIDSLSPKVELPASPVVAVFQALPLDPMVIDAHNAKRHMLTTNPSIPRPRLSILFQVFTI